MISIWHFEIYAVVPRAEADRSVAAVRFALAARDANELAEALALRIINPRDAPV